FKRHVLHQDFESQITVGKDIERRVPAPSRQFDKGWIARQVAPQGSYVENKPDQWLARARVPSSDGNTDNNILRAGISTKQHLKGRQHGHEERTAFALT